MLERIHIKNFKCLLDVEVELGDFTVLIGPNDSGKSSFLDAIRCLGQIATQPLQTAFSGERSLSNLVWRKDKSRNVAWEIAGNTLEDSFTYFIELSAENKCQNEYLVSRGRDVFRTTEGGDVKILTGAQAPHHVLEKFHRERSFLQGKVAQGKQPYLAIAQEFRASPEYRFDPTKLYEPTIPEPEPVLLPSGENLAGVLDALQNRPDRSDFEALQKALHEAISTLQGIILPSVRDQKGAKTIEFLLSGNGKPPVTISARLASTGALLVTAYLALSYDQTPGLLLLEEPENGLHPFLLETVINLLRRISTGEVGNRKRQVIVTTHSPLLLNYVKPEEVRVFVRHPEQGTKVKSMQEVPDIDRLLKEFATGELWYLLGEEKLFEGQPA